MFRNGHVRLNLQAADDGGLQALGRRLDFMQHSVDAVTNAESLGQWLEMNIGSAHLERLDNQ